MFASRFVGNVLAAPETAMGQLIIEEAGLVAHEVRKDLPFVLTRQIRARARRRQIKLGKVALLDAQRRCSANRLR